MNLQVPKFKTLRKQVVHLFSYLGRFKFVTVKDNKDFCTLHRLAFFVHADMKYHEAIVAFRTFLRVLLSIKLSVVDGQRWMISITTALENSVLLQYSPVKHARLLPQPSLASLSEIYQLRRINWMFEDSIPKLCTLCKDYLENSERRIL